MEWSMPFDRKMCNGEDEILLPFSVEDLFNEI